MPNPSQLTRLKLGPGETRSVDLVSATELKARLSSVLDSVLRNQPVVIARHDRPTAVVISIEDFDALVERIPDPIESLRQRFAGLLERIEAPGATAASDAMFSASADELASAAAKHD